MVSNASDAQKAVMVSNVTGNVIVIEIKDVTMWKDV